MKKRLKKGVFGKLAVTVFASCMLISTAVSAGEVEKNTEIDSALPVSQDSAEVPGDDDFAATEALFSQWNPDAPSKQALIEYVEDVTDESSPDFIPPEDRIATFDMDGTLMAELAPTYLEVMLLTERILADPSYQPDDEMLEFGRMTRDHALDKSFPEDYDYEFSYHQAKAFAGMTLDEYADFITRFLLKDADGFEGMTYAEAFYLPMVEVVEYLQENGFKCFVVSGSDRFIVRTFIEGMLDIPSENIIGSDTALKASGQGNTDGIEYVFTEDDKLVRTDRLLIKDLKTNKVLQIAQEIGKQPVLSFGNSSGDVSMNNYALLNNPYRSAVFQLVADDDVRDYGNPEKGKALRKQWEDLGYNVISMRDDWKTIYGEDVIKTGSFHWLEDYADDMKQLKAIYLGVDNYGAEEVNKDTKEAFQYRFLVAGKEVLLGIDSGEQNENGEYEYPVQNVLKEQYPFEITVKGDTVVSAREIREDGIPAFDSVVNGIPGEKTLGNFLKIAMEPVGTTLYIYGGGWDWQDAGSSVQAKTIGVSPDWVRFFWEQDENFTYKSKDGNEDNADPAKSYYPYGGFNEYYYAGLDCSGFLGWALYNTFETENGKDGYVTFASAYAKKLAEEGYGDYTRKIEAPVLNHDCEMKPGDIMSIGGHVWISLGTCGDGSVVILHSTPADSRTGQPGGGVELSAIGLSEECEAYQLADRYMSEYYPEWYERYPVKLADPETYFSTENENAGRFTWDTDKGEVKDPERVRDMTPQQVLDYLFDGKQ